MKISIIITNIVIGISLIIITFQIWNQLYWILNPINFDSKYKQAFLEETNSRLEKNCKKYTEDEICKSREAYDKHIERIKTSYLEPKIPALKHTLYNSFIILVIGAVAFIAILGIDKRRRWGLILSTLSVFFALLFVSSPTPNEILNPPIELSGLFRNIKFSLILILLSIVLIINIIYLLRNWRIFK